MKTSIILTVFFVFSFTLLSIFPQEKYEYVKEKDPLVLKKLDHWQDLKFGLMMHWGTYSQWGIVESWSLCSEDEPWCKRKMDDYCEYKKAYEGLKKTFNPVDFNPEKWAEAAKAAGMKYVVFTTKHHDGFCMFDTKQTDYKITSKECPFHTNPKANVAKEIFNTFRNDGFMIGAYFSKPDWHSNYYWWRYFATPDRNVNYSIKKHPDRWQKFVDFTHNQIDELMSDYGRMDILWLDGGWVHKYSKEELERFKKDTTLQQLRIQSQDIDMPGIVKDARAKQPGLIVVDRAVPGPYQDYLTPENTVPDTTLPYPWETCMPMATSWSYVPHDRYKSGQKLVHLLVDIVAKGGNFLLNIGPSPKGDFDPVAYERLKEIGDWMKVNSEAIYYSRPIKPYKDGKVCLTQLKNGNVYAIYLADKDENSIPAKIELTKYCPAENSDIELLGTDTKIKWQKKGDGCEFEIPESVRSNPPCKYAWTFKIQAH